MRRLGVVILGAGASVRMGTPKLLLPWHDKTILAHLIEQWKALGAAQLAVVVEKGSEVEKEIEEKAKGKRLKAEWGGVNIEPSTSNIQNPTSNVERPREEMRVEVIINPKPEVGMWSSVQCAARWNGWKKDLTHFVISLGDQPQVGTQTLKGIINFAAANAECICQPSRKGRGRHPVVMPRSVLLELANAKESNLKEFLQTREKRRRLLEVGDAGLDLDVDTPEDYERAVKWVK